MDIEELTKSQLLLLTILVNFVTAVATGILTVSLLDTAPPVVTQTINKVVEHTVETVTQVAPAAVVQAPKPSVEDLITAAFAADAARTVSLYDSKLGTSTSMALGTLLPKAKAVITTTGLGLPKEIIVGFAGGTFEPASLAQQSDTLLVYRFSDTAVLPASPTLTLLGAKDLKIGQTALGIAREGGVTGIVSRVVETTVHTSLPLLPPGVSAVDLSGNLIGISSGVAGIFVSSDVVRELLSATTSPATPAT